MKTKVLFVIGCISLVLISCLDSDNDYEVVVVRDAQIKTMTLSHDSVPGLSDVVFTIDQVNGQIFNKDSMPYGTDVSTVVCSLTYVTGVAGIQVTQEALPDSTYYWNGSDSLDFSKPVKFVTTAYDGITTKTYLAKLNIHTVVPDSMVWTLHADDVPSLDTENQKVIRYKYQGADVYFLYTGSSEGYRLSYSSVSDLKSWTELPLTGLPGDGRLTVSQLTAYNGKLYISSEDGILYESPDGLSWTSTEGALPVKYILGALKEGRQPSSLAVIVTDGGALRFAGMNQSGTWTTGDVIPEEFPLEGFGSINYNNMYYEYLMVAAGRDVNDQLTNVAWSTMNGVGWVPFTNKNVASFEKKEGVMLSVYDGKLCLVGGINEKGNGSKEIHFSSDYGVTWQLSDTLTVFPDEYAGRGFGSVIVDEDNFMLIFGGKTSSNSTPRKEIWRGRINRLGFKD